MNAKSTSATTVVSPQSPALAPGLKWNPVQGEQATGVAKRTGLEGLARQALIDSAARILGGGVNPKAIQGEATGLVVGYVQSGKTLSFTTVIGLARDNGFPIVILVAGNKDNLLTQSHKRLARDLDVDGGDGLPAWIMEKNPRVQDSQYEQLLKRTIANWNDKTRDDDEKPTLLLTVLKQNHRLSALTGLLSKMDLKGVPALIIDDEADQASLNTKVNEGEESTTYTRICELRDALPCHTFLQYTATPQAPLLINIADTLSPDFVHVLEPGEGYVGGAEFFAQHSPYVKVIPPADIPPNNAIPVDPPESLLRALRLFFVGLAASIIGGTGRRSMLIHPARERFVHKESADWASAAKDEWNSALGASDQDRSDAIADFRVAYDELLTTEVNLPPFDAIVDKLPRALRNTTVIEFNTRGSPKTPEINWRHAEGWILVGGQAVDRGFTVESLSVTYMPRGVGGGNADAMQQRARFFGYKRKYLGICRIYLEQALKTAFENYVEHEEMMRDELKGLSRSGASLRSWRRRLILDPALRPCRRSVISDDLTRVPPNGGWTRQRGALMTPEVRAANSAVLDKLIASLPFESDESYISTSLAQRHQVARQAPLKLVIDALVDYVCQDPRDTGGFTGLLITLSEVLRRDPNATAAVYRMRPQATVGHREIKANGSIETILQGPTDREGAYPGDAFFCSPNTLTMQLHRYDLRLNDETVAVGAPLVAFHVPRGLAKSWLVQVQQGQ
jgi:Z1 domain